jgi:hypothetical protein
MDLTGAARGPSSRRRGLPPARVRVRCTSRSSNCASRTTSRRRCTAHETTDSSACRSYAASSSRRSAAASWAIFRAFRHGAADAADRRRLRVHVAPLSLRVFGRPVRRTASSKSSLPSFGRSAAFEPVRQFADAAGAVRMRWYDRTRNAPRRDRRWLAPRFSVTFDLTVGRTPRPFGR